MFFRVFNGNNWQRKLLVRRSQYKRGMVALFAPKKKFTPKYNLPILKDYSVPAPDSFWEKFQSNYVMPKPSLIDWKELECLAIKMNYPDKNY